MSQLSKIVELIFKGVDNTGPAIDSVLSNTQKLSSQIEGIAAPIADVTGKILKTEAAILLSGAALVTYASTVAREFDIEFGKVSTLLTDLTDDELDKFNREIKDFASTSATSLSDIYAAVFNILSSGAGDVETALDFLREAENLANAGFGSLENVTSLLTGVLNAYNLEADQAGRVSQILFSTAKEGTTDLDSLSRAMGSLLPVIGPLGVPLEEVGAAIITMTNAAGAGNESQVMTILAGLISDLVTPSDAAAKAASELGIELGAAEFQSKGLAGMLGEIITAAEQTENPIDTLGEIIRSDTGFRGALILGADGMGQFKEAMTDVREGGEDLGIAIDRVEKDLDRGVNAWNLFLVELGSPFRVPVEGIKDSFADVLRAITDSLGDDDQLGAVRQIVVDVFQDVADTFAEAAKNLPAALEQADFSGFENGLTTVIEAVRNLFSSVDLSTEEGLVAFIEGIGQLFDTISGFTAQIIEIFTPAIQGLGESIPTLLNVAEALAPYAGIIGATSIALDKLLPLLNTLLIAVIAIKSAGAAAVFAGLAAALAPLAALAAAFAGGSALGNWLNDFLGTSDALADLLWMAFGTEPIELQEQAIVELSDEYKALVATIRESVDEVDEFIKGLSDVSTEFVEYGQALQAGKKITGEFTLEQAELILGMGSVAKSMDDTASAVENLTDNEMQRLREIMQENPGMTWADAFDELVRELDAAGRALGDFVFDVDATFSDIYDAVADGFIDVGFGEGLLEPFIQALRDAGVATEEFTTGDLADLYQIMQDDPSLTITEALERLREDLEKTGDSAKDARDKIEEELDLTQIEIARIEAAVALDIAEIEAGTERLRIEAETWTELARIEGDIEIANLQETTKRVEAAFSSIDNIFTTTGSTIDGLVSAMLGVEDTDRFAREKINAFTDALDSQIRIQEQAADNQTKLIDAQVKELEARTSRLRSGEALISVDGTGLEPELNSFLFRILNNIQIRANAEASALLLGI